MRRCHTHGITSTTDRNRMRSLDCRKNAITPADGVSLAAILTWRSRSCSVKMTLGDSTIEAPRSLRDSVILSVLTKTKEESCKRDRAAFCAVAGSALDYRDGSCGEHCFSP